MNSLSHIYRSLGATRGDRLVMFAMAALVGLMPFVLVLAHRGIAPLALALGAVVALRAGVWSAGIPHFLTRPRLGDPLVRGGLFLLAFCIWIAATSLWSPSQGAWRLMFNVGAPALAAGAAVWEINRRAPPDLAFISRATEASLVAAVALLLFEALTGGFLRAIVPPTDVSPERVKDLISLGRGATGLTTVIFAGLFLMERRGRWRALLGALFAGAFVAASRLGISANDVALVAGAAAGAAALRWPRTTLATATSACVLVLFAAPLAAVLPVDLMFELAPVGAPPSWLQRLVIWKTAAREAFACLPFGCGAEYARTLSNAAGEAAIPGAGHPLPALPVHPHNVFLEIWLELGLPGVVLFAGALASGGQALIGARLPRAAAAAVAATAASVFVAASVELSLWQVWRLGAVVLAAFIIALGVKAGRARAPALKKGIGRKDAADSGRGPKSLVDD